ncbi:MAG: zinc ribbon domain-containing protein [Trichodesmium sp. ALOHA_ZT_67]|nr:transposase [Trichodesmium erythraeum GBRTRLIN201]MCH2050450.1 zinc ribbon domain-containing protein [Trichodesmium sp. ALOHA_ZT_67]MDE5095295.1 zinc ribbon domain-containing protein [Trichodesmium sp. St11_bin5]MDT9340558.1 zinc ribbon domain-containing protein [Trichodesmium erythraeum 21-75]
MIDISSLLKSCSSCGYVVEKLPLNIREQDSPKCSSHHDRDINAHFKHFGFGCGTRRIILGHGLYI